MSTPTEEPGRDRRGTTTLLLALLVAALVVIGAVTALLIRHDSDDTAAPDTSTATTPSGSGQASGFAMPDIDKFGRRVDVPNNRYGQPLPQAGTPRRASDPDWLTAAPTLPEQGGWQRVFGTSVPFSTSDGPTAILDGVPVGYSHTPQGAALAAVYVTWQAYARPGDWTLRERMEVMTAADRTEFERLKAAGKVPDQAPAAVTQWLTAPDGFRIESWANDLCLLRLATKAEPASSGAPRWLASQVAMVWDGQGWRLRLAADGELPKTSLDSLEGWTTW